FVYSPTKGMHVIVMVDAHNSDTIVDTDSSDDYSHWELTKAGGFTTNAGTSTTTKQTENWNNKIDSTTFTWDMSNPSSYMNILYDVLNETDKGNKSSSETVQTSNITGAKTVTETATWHSDVDRTDQPESLHAITAPGNSYAFTPGPTIGGVQTYMPAMVGPGGIPFTRFDASLGYYWTHDVKDSTESLTNSTIAPSTTSYNVNDVFDSKTKVTSSWETRENGDINKGYNDLTTSNDKTHHEVHESRDAKGMGYYVDSGSSVGGSVEHAQNTSSGIINTKWTQAHDLTTTYSNNHNHRALLHSIDKTYWLKLDDYQFNSYVSTDKYQAIINDPGSPMPSGSGSTSVSGSMQLKGHLNGDQYTQTITSTSGTSNSNTLTYPNGGGTTTSGNSTFQTTTSSWVTTIQQDIYVPEDPVVASVTSAMVSMLSHMGEPTIGQAIDYAFETVIGWFAPYANSISQAVSELNSLWSDFWLIMKHFDVFMNELAVAIPQTIADGRAVDSAVGCGVAMTNQVLGVDLERFGVGPIYGNQDAFNGGKWVGNIAGTGMNIVITVSGGAPFRCGSNFQKVVKGMQTIQDGMDIIETGVALASGETTPWDVASGLLQGAVTPGIGGGAFGCFVAGTPVVMSRHGTSLADVAAQATKTDEGMGIDWMLVLIATATVPIALAGLPRTNSSQKRPRTMEEKSLDEFFAHLDDLETVDEPNQTTFQPTRDGGFEINQSWTPQTSPAKTEDRSAWRPIAVEGASRRSILAGGPANVAKVNNAPMLSHDKQLSVPFSIPETPPDETRISKEAPNVPSLSLATPKDNPTTTKDSVVSLGALIKAHPSDPPDHPDPVHPIGIGVSFNTIARISQSVVKLGIIGSDPPVIAAPDLNHQPVLSPSKPELSTSRIKGRPTISAATRLPKSAPQPKTEVVNQRGSVWWMCGWMLLGCLCLFQGLWGTNASVLQPLSASVSRDYESLDAAEFKPIESIELGERVAVDEERGDHDQEFGADVDPATWKQIDLRAPKKDGTWAEVSLLRPAKWLEEQLALSHQTMQISVPECGIDGRAEIRRIRPCPVIRPGPGRVVTGTFKHQSARVVDVYVEGSEEPIGATGNHPFWSEDRKDYVRADELKAGERLRTFDERTPRVSEIIPRDEYAQVFNLEIQSAHVYYIGDTTLLVHNAPKAATKAAGQCKTHTGEKGEYRDVGGHHVHAQSGFKDDASYNKYDAFAVSQDYMTSRGWDHTAMTKKQRQEFDKLDASGKPNTLAAHSRIARAALVAGGATKEQARSLVAESLRNLQSQGVTGPSGIPWNQ
ncbi:MAG: repeat-associated core domain protein, partial [Planctomycetaceae bacterium]|nr:repeat-associated core domain protein [Planctomycetaceae bacterium]